MSAGLIQRKCGLREKQPRLASDGMRVLAAALDVWCLRNGYAAARTAREMIDADFARNRVGGGAR